jgi:hypothetical protein
MAVILKTSFTLNNTPEPIEPVLYVDTINKDAFVAEMYSFCLGHIRKNTDTTDPSVVSKIKRENFIVDNENDIYYNKKDGFWMISNEKTKVVTLYKRTTLVGYLYNTIEVKKIFTLSCIECPRVVPRVFTKPTLFDNFAEELSMSVANYRSRTDTLK